MTPDEFAAMVATSHTRADGLILVGGKGTEYQTNSDTLSNFKTLGEELDQHPIVVASIYMKKHHTSIMKAVKNVGKGNEKYVTGMAEPLSGRFDDHINYLLLMEALFRNTGIQIDGETQSGSNAARSSRK